jgi:hypothetical protein
MRRTAAAAVPLALLALVMAGCGEREEPEIDTSATESEFQITGEWEGRLTQKGLKPFMVRATIVSLERSKQNVVHYTGIDCSGTWDYLGASATAYRFREVIDRGAGRTCKGVGTVALAPLTDDSVDYVFTGGGITSRGVLRRRG